MEDYDLILACIPKDDPEQLNMCCRKGIVYNLSKCNMCDCEIFISERQGNMCTKYGYQTWCAHCVFRLKSILPDHKCQFVNIKDMQ